MALVNKGWCVTAEPRLTCTKSAVVRCSYGSDNAAARCIFILTWCPSHRQLLMQERSEDPALCWCTDAGRAMVLLPACSHNPQSAIGMGIESLRTCAALSKHLRARLCLHMRLTAYCSAAW